MAGKIKGFFLAATALSLMACFPRRPSFPKATPHVPPPSAAADEAPVIAPFVMAKTESNDGTLGQCGLSFYAPRAAVTTASCLQGIRVLQLPDLTISTNIWRHPSSAMAGDGDLDLAVVTFAPTFEHSYWPLAQATETLTQAQTWSGDVWLKNHVTADSPRQFRIDALSARAEALVGAPILTGGKNLRGIILRRAGAQLVALDMAQEGVATWIRCFAEKNARDADDDLAAVCRPSPEISHSDPLPKGSSWQSL